MLEFIKEFIVDAKTAWDFIFRNLFWIIVGVLAFIVLGSLTEMKTVILTIVLIESLALGLSNLAAYVYTKLNFVKEYGLVLGYVFLGVHILVGLVTLLVYFTNFAAKAG
jgi:hypothetical protein